MYKDNCGFRKINVCTFKEDDCSPEKCDMYSFDFDSRSIKKAMVELEKEIRTLSNELLDIKKVAKMYKEEKRDGQTEDVKAYKKRMKYMEDLGKGHKYLKKAYIYTKRTKK